MSTTWPAAAPQRKSAGPSTAASRTSRPRRKARKPTAAKPRLAKPTSAWNGLFSQPMKRAAMSPKKMWNTAL